MFTQNLSGTGKHTMTIRIETDHMVVLSKILAMLNILDSYAASVGFEMMWNSEASQSGFIPHNMNWNEKIDISPEGDRWFAVCERVGAPYVGRGLGDTAAEAVSKAREQLEYFAANPLPVRSMGAPMPDESDDDDQADEEDTAPIAPPKPRKPYTPPVLTPMDARARYRAACRAMRIDTGSSHQQKVAMMDEIFGMRLTTYAMCHTSPTRNFYHTMYRWYDDKRWDRFTDWKRARQMGGAA